MVIIEEVKIHCVIELKAIGLKVLCIFDGKVYNRLLYRITNLLWIYYIITFCFFPVFLDYRMFYN